MNPKKVTREPSIDEADFVSRESVVVAKEKGRGKRSVEEMMLSMDTAAERATYGIKRIDALLDQVADVLKFAGKEAAQLIVKERKSLKRFMPEEWEE